MKQKDDLNQYVGRRYRQGDKQYAITGIQGQKLVATTPTDETKFLTKAQVDKMQRD